MRFARALTTGPCARGRRRFPGIVGPGVLRITSAKLFPNLGIGAIPEAPEVARHLDRPSVRRQQREPDRFLAYPDSGGVGKAEELLELHRGRHASVVVVLETHGAPARNDNCLRRVAIERTSIVPRERTRYRHVGKRPRAHRRALRQLSEIVRPPGKTEAPKQLLVVLIRSSREPRLSEERGSHGRVRRR